MSLVYFDASAFVKLLAEEPGSDLAAAARNHDRGSGRRHPRSASAP